MNNTTTRPIAGIEMNDILSYLIVAILTICDLISIKHEALGAAFYKDYRYWNGSSGTERRFGLCIRPVMSHHE